MIHMSTTCHKDRIAILETKEKLSNSYYLMTEFLLRNRDTEHRVQRISLCSNNLLEDDEGKNGIRAGCNGRIRRQDSRHYGMATVTLAKAKGHVITNTLHGPLPSFT